MVRKNVYQTITEQNGSLLAVLVDPDKQSAAGLQQLIARAVQARVDFFFVGGSLLMDDRFEHTICTLKSACTIPVVIFPGNSFQVSRFADALLFLSLISGRNPEYLIGQHVVAAPLVKEIGIETIATGYLLIDGGQISTTSYITQTVPVPKHKPEVAIATAIAGELLGMKAIYLEAGSGAIYPVNREMIASVKKQVSLPLIVGGGIRTAEQAEEACRAGADVLVVGNILEKQPELLLEISLAVHGAVKDFQQ